MQVARVIHDCFRPPPAIAAAKLSEHISMLITRAASVSTLSTGCSRALDGNRPPQKRKSPAAIATQVLLRIRSRALVNIMELHNTIDHARTARKPPPILQEMLNQMRLFILHPACNMRRDQAVRRCPERIVRWQWFR